MRKFIAVIFCSLLVSPALAQAPRPKSLVAAIDGGRLAVLASGDGRASNIRGQFTEVRSIAVTSDGRSVIVENGPRDCRTEGGFEKGSYQPEIDRVVIETGARKRLVGGAGFPAVNTRGIVASGDVCDGESAVNLSDLVTGRHSRRSAFGESTLGQAVIIGSVRPLAWLSDGLTLFYQVSVTGESYPRYYFGRLWPLVQVKDEVFRRVGAALHESGFDPTAAALVDDKTIAFAAGTDVREWDVSTERLLPSDRHFHFAETITALTVDPSGRHFLVVTRNHILYRWSVGDTAPTRLAYGVSAMAWLP